MTSQMPRRSKREEGGGKEIHTRTGHPATIRDLYGDHHRRRLPSMLPRADPTLPQHVLGAHLRSRSPSLPPGDHPRVARSRWAQVPAIRGGKSDKAKSGAANGPLETRDHLLACSRASDLYDLVRAARTLPSHTAAPLGCQHAALDGNLV